MADDSHLRFASENLSTGPVRIRVRERTGKKDFMNLRCSIRTETMLDLSLAPNARILYYIIDDKANALGEMWWHWKKLAALIGVDKGRYFELAGQLLKAGRITMRKEGRRVIYSVRKIGPNAETQSEKSDCSVRKIGLNGGSILNEPDHEPERARCASGTFAGPNEPPSSSEGENQACSFCGGDRYVIVQRVIRGQGYQERRPCVCVKTHALAR